MRGKITLFGLDGLGGRTSPAPGTPFPLFYKFVLMYSLGRLRSHPHDIQAKAQAPTTFWPRGIAEGL